MAKEKEEQSSIYGLPLPKGVTLQDLQDNWNTADAEYAPARKRIKVLDLADTGKIWDIIAKQFPSFQITPDTNYVNYVKENIVASVYTVGRAASLTPKRLADKEFADGINRVLDTIWGGLDVPSYQLQAGERAALTNIGITQVGWAADIIRGTKDAFYKGDVVFKNIDPMNYMRDPYAPDLDTAAYVIYFENYHKTTLMADPDYAKAMEGKTLDSICTDIGYVRETGGNPSSMKNYYQLAIHWVKVYDEEKKKVVIHEIHTINTKFVLFVKSDIQPSIFPFAELYSSLPVKDPIGVSEPAKILSSSIVLNLLDGIVVTHAYKAGRPPKLISDTSGLNVRAFREYGNEPDMAFPVRGDASKAVQYIQFPPLPQGLDQVSARLSMAIQQITGIDAKYTGKDTGSILTTGGIDSMLAQATMRDTTRIKLYEAYTRRLTELVIQYLIEYGDKRTYMSKPANTIKGMDIEIDFKKADVGMSFNYQINIDAETPKSKARLAAAATDVIEKSAQYQFNPPLMTPEEWLMYQDYPQKDLILERLKVDRENNKTEEVVQVLSTFANMVAQGMDPNQAINTIVQQLQMQQDPNAAQNMQPEVPPMAGQGMM